MKFDLYYMIDPHAVDLKAAVVESFTNFFTPRWNLHLVNSFDHLACMALGLETDSHVMIAESGVLFTSRTEMCMKRSIDNVTGIGWDFAFPEIEFVDKEEMQRIFRPEAEMLNRNDLQVHALRNISFTGVRCYAINKWSKHKVHEFLQKRPENIAYEKYLVTAINAGEVRGYVVYPYSISRWPNTSTSAAPSKPVEADEHNDVIAEWGELFQ